MKIVLNAHEMTPKKLFNNFERIPQLQFNFILVIFTFKDVIFVIKK